jgi:hypothetical protein
MATLAWPVCRQSDCRHFIAEGLPDVTVTPQCETHHMATMVIGKTDLLVDRTRNTHSSRRPRMRYERHCWKPSPAQSPPREPVWASRSGHRRLRILVTGGLSGWEYEAKVAWVLDMYLSVCRKARDRIVVIEGGLSGIDRLAREWATEHSPEVDHDQVSPRWMEPGGNAPAAVEALFTTHRPDVVLAFHENLRSSQRTRAVLRCAREQGVPQDLYVTALCQWQVGGIPFRIIDAPPDRSSQMTLFDGWGSPSKGWQRRTDEKVCTLFDGWEPL